MIKEVREFYGITQELLADHLKISRSQLSMAESGRRAVPTTALAYLTRLYQAIPRSATRIQDMQLKELLAGQKAQLDKFASHKIRLNEHKMAKLTKQLDQMAETQARACNLLTSLNAIKDDFPEPSDKSLIYILRANANKEQQETNGLAQLKLKISIQKLQTENDYLRI